MAIADRSGLPISICIGSARPHETRFVEWTLARRWTREFPERLIGDKAYDSDKLDAHLWERYGVELIAPNRSNRKVRSQDGRPMRRYKRRWKVERLFAWLQNFRRITTRYERHAENYLGMVRLGCMVILLRHL